MQDDNTQKTINQLVNDWFKVSEKLTINDIPVAKLDRRELASLVAMVHYRTRGERWYRNNVHRVLWVFSFINMVVLGCFLWGIYHG